MKYDATGIPAVYDRGRSLDPEVLAFWIGAVRARVSDAMVSVILDLGCGTGQFSEALAEQWASSVVGIDPSKQMLARAQNKRHDDRVQYAAGYGEFLPLPSRSVDLIFMSMVFHHFADPHGVARECSRVLRDGGYAVVRTGTRERIEAFPSIPFFPTSRPLLEERLPSILEVRSTFEAAGFYTISTDVVTQQVAPTYSAYAERVAVGADSVLASLNPSDFQAGLIALCRHAAAMGNQPVVGPLDLLVFRAQVINDDLKKRRVKSTLQCDGHRDSASFAGGHRA